MTPPVSAIFARAPEEDTDLNGVYIPKGTPVAVDIRNMHYNPKVWKDPYRFNPDRFAPGGEAESQEGMAWLPFSNGGRQCIGMNFSLAEQRVLLSMLCKLLAFMQSGKKVADICIQIVRKYSWTLPEDSIHKDGLITNSAGLIGPIDLRITFTKRYWCTYAIVSYCVQNYMLPRKLSFSQYTVYWADFCTSLYTSQSNTTPAQIAAQSTNKTPGNFLPSPGSVIVYHLRFFITLNPVQKNSYCYCNDLIISTWNCICPSCSSAWSDEMHLQPIFKGLAGMLTEQAVLSSWTSVITANAIMRI